MSGGTCISKNMFDYVMDSLRIEAEKLPQRTSHGYVGLSGVPTEHEIGRIMDEVQNEIESMKLVEEYGYRAEFEEFPREDWLHEVREDNTRRGYWGWVYNKLQARGERHVDAR